MRIRSDRRLEAKGWLIVTVATAIMVSAAETEAQGRLGGSQAPTVDATLVGGRAHVDGDAVTFRISVTVPPEHHGYVDKGDDGFYIPFAFTFPALEAAGAESTLLERPQGVRDDKVKAFVLRGRGEFEFALRPPEALRTIDELDASLRYQVCNDRTGICYPPRRLTLKVPLR